MKIQAMEACMKIKFGKRKRFLLILGLTKIYIRDLKKTRHLYFLKISRYAFAIIRPVWINEGVEFKWIFGWYSHPPINPMTNLTDIILIEFHFWNKILPVYRKFKEQSL